MNDVLQWLQVHGNERDRAVDKAAALLTEPYRRKYSKIVPPELHRLSALASARLVFVESLPGGARLVPMPGGFEILIDANLNHQRARTAIAHELVHTLFYSREREIPTRLIRPSKGEEHFCFDVARRVLAPMWMIESAGILELRAATEIFAALLKTFKLSRPVAARLMLQDYRFASGVAATWMNCEGAWTMRRGNCFASPELSKAERSRLHNLARSWLRREPLSDTMGIRGYTDHARKSAFVLVEVAGRNLTRAARAASGAA